ANETSYSGERRSHIETRLPRWLYMTQVMTSRIRSTPRPTSGSDLSADFGLVNRFESNPGPPSSTSIRTRSCATFQFTLTFCGLSTHFNVVDRDKEGPTCQRARSFEPGSRPCPCSKAFNKASRNAMRTAAWSMLLYPAVAISPAIVLTTACSAAAPLRPVESDS